MTVDIEIYSEIGELETVIIHTPGREVENMTPEDAERALYSDILNLSVLQQEFSQFRGILQKVSQVYEVSDLLAQTLKNEKVRQNLISKICQPCLDPSSVDELYDVESDELARLLIEGIELKRDRLTNFLNPQRFALRPLHNFFYTRDAAAAIFDKVLIASTASQIREREAQIMEAVFDFHPMFNASTFGVSLHKKSESAITIEGGDVIVVSENVIVTGWSMRTTPAGIDLIVDKMKERQRPVHILVQELPVNRESFIHLDMVFTLLSHHECLVFEPVIMQTNRFKTIHIIVNGKRVEIREEKNLLKSLKQLGYDFEPIFCGGKTDTWIQEREQWHSGANFFAFAPGKIIGYNRNLYTLEELSNSGYEIIAAEDILDGQFRLNDFKKCVVTIEGSELSRGGGGARCMTLPVRRKPVQWE